MNKKILCFLVATYPILSAYGLNPQADFGSFALLLFGIINYVGNSKHFHPRLPVGYMAFFIVAVLFAVIFTRSLPLRLILFTLNLLFACSYVDLVLLKKYYSYTVAICCAFLLIQEITSIVLGSRVSGLVSFLPTIYNSIVDDYRAVAMEAERSASLFLEPSYFAQYLAPFIIWNVFSEKNQDMKKAILASLFIVLSRSGNGMILLMIIWGVWFFFGNIKKSVKISTIAIAVIGYFVLNYYDPETVELMLDRTSEFQSYNGDEQFQSSGFIRFFRGYYLYADMPLINQLFGANPELVQSMMGQNIFFMASEDVSYNGIQTLLLHNGLFVCILYIVHLLAFCKKPTDKAMIVMVVCFIYLLAGESYYLSSRSFVVTVILYFQKNYLINKKAYESSIHN